MIPSLLVPAVLLLQAAAPLPGLTPTALRPLGTLRQQADVQQEWLRYLAALPGGKFFDELVEAGRGLE